MLGPAGLAKSPAGQIPTRLREGCYLWKILCEFDSPATTAFVGVGKPLAKTPSPLNFGLGYLVGSGVGIEPLPPRFAIIFAQPVGV